MIMIMMIGISLAAAAAAAAAAAVPEAVEIESNCSLSCLENRAFSPPTPSHTDPPARQRHQCGGLQ